VGQFNWGRGDVNVNVNRYNNFNRTNISNGNWNHDGNRRGSVPYRDQGSRDKFGGHDRQAAQARDQFRGRDDGLGGGGLQDRQGLQQARNDPAVRDTANRDRQGAGDRGGAGSRDLAGDRGGAGSRDLGGDRGGPSAGTRDLGGTGGGAGSNRAATSDRGGAFSGGNGASTRSASDRGRSSMSSGAASRGGGAARGGGGGGRGGGGRR